MQHLSIAASFYRYYVPSQHGEFADPLTAAWAYEAAHGEPPTAMRTEACDRDGVALDAWTEAWPTPHTR